jgi:hypothetical protein
LLIAGLVQVYEKYPVSRTPYYRTLQDAARLAESGSWPVCGWEN